jgi:hypothetical protein
MQFDISVDTEALVVDAYPQMRSAENTGVHTQDMDIAWGFYCAMHERHPEMVAAYRDRMREMVKAVRDIERAASGHNIWWTDEEIEEDRAIVMNAAMRGKGNV